MLGALISGCITFEKQSGVLRGFEVHEWGVFCQVYNSNIVNVFTNPKIEPVIVRKPVIYFHYDGNISEVDIEIDINGDILVTIPDAVNTSTGIGWTVDIVNNSVVTPDGTVYEYLFYECQMNISQCVVAYVLYDGKNVTFYVKNIGGYPLSDIFFIYGNYNTSKRLELLKLQEKHPELGISFEEHMGFRDITFIHINSLGVGEEKSITIPINNSSSYDTKDILQSLINCGLTEKESQDLVDYWQEMWFNPPNWGSFAHVIYTIPQEVYDELLPISINPKPETMHRVGLFFVTDIPINQPVLSNFTVKESCSQWPWEESFNFSWLNNNTLVVEANVLINCCESIGNGSIALQNNILNLKYEVFSNSSYLCDCMCLYTTKYLIRGIPKDDYEIELVPKLIEY